MCLAWYPKCFHLLHLMCSTQSSAQRGQTLLTEKTETQRGQMIIQAARAETTTCIF